MSKDAHIYKKYDDAKTPYKRCLESDKLSEEEKQKLIKIKKGLNIIELKKTVEMSIRRCLKICRHTVRFLYDKR